MSVTSLKFSPAALRSDGLIHHAFASAHPGKLGSLPDKTKPRSKASGLIVAQTGRFSNRFLGDLRLVVELSA